MKEKKVMIGSRQRPAEPWAWSCHVWIGLPAAAGPPPSPAGIASEAFRNSIIFETLKIKIGQ